MDKMTQLNTTLLKLNKRVISICFGIVLRMFHTLSKFLLGGCCC